nr:hypothetical protein Iba_chr03aCG20370 [Ipomoea batatas]
MFWPPLFSRNSFACFSVKTCFVESMLREDIYCVLTSQETPLSVGLSFLLMPSFLIGVIGSSSRNKASSSRSRGVLSPLGGLPKLRSSRSRGIPRSGSTYS